MNESHPNAASVSRTGQTLAPHPVLDKFYSTEAERRAQLREAFDGSARHYDLINKAMSFGTDVWYRRVALKRAGLTTNMHVLDVGCGTGLIAENAEKLGGPQSFVVGLDPSLGMLHEAARRGRVRRPVNGVAEQLPFHDESFDFLCMSYALRHVADLLLTFREYRRVLKPGGTILILELTPPRSGLRGRLLRFYMKYVVPAATRVGTVSRQAQWLYSYCWDSFEFCVPPDTIMDAMRDAGLTRIDRHVELGIFSEYRARR